MVRHYMSVKRIYLICRENYSLNLLSFFSGFIVTWFQWFHNHYKADSGKSHVMLTANDSLKMNVKGSLLSSEKTVKVLGIIVYNKLSPEPHINKVCKKVSQKIYALARVSKLILQNK